MGGVRPGQQAVAAAGAFGEAPVATVSLLALDGVEEKWYETFHWDFGILSLKLVILYTENEGTDSFIYSVSSECEENSRVTGYLLMTFMSLNGLLSVS